MKYFQLLCSPQMLVDTVSNFCREATHCVNVKMFRIKVSPSSMIPAILGSDASLFAPPI